MGGLYRGAVARTRALGRATGGGDEERRGAARFIAADACGSDTRRNRPRRYTLLYRRRPSAARAADPTHPRARRDLLDDRPPRFAPCPLRARGNRMDQGALCRAAGHTRRRPLARPARSGEKIRANTISAAPTRAR